MQWAPKEESVRLAAEGSLVLWLQMQLQRGVVAVSRTLASQQAWIFHGNVRENMPFGEKYDRQR